MSNLKRFWIKSASFLQRLLRSVVWLPKKLTRLVQHIGFGMGNFSKPKQANFLAWWQDFALLLADVLAIPELYETFSDFAKWNTRPLSPLEKKLARSVFGTSLHLDAIRVDNKAILGCRNRNIVYVSFFTINAWGKIKDEILVHELVHVWQYQKLGAAYIAKALRAQRTELGYDYGGVGALRQAKAESGRMESFNLEQQAEIIADYYLLREGKTPSWGKANSHDLPVYQYFVDQLQSAG